MLPDLQLLEKVSRKIMSVPNRRKESKRGVHFGLFLLGFKSGLRVNEAVNFDLNTKTQKGLYRISKPKGKKERLVYVSKEVIRELKKSNWQPNQTNRWNFYHFLKKVKRELNIGKNIELTPHTLRRSFATYQAESGMPLPLLQKLLGHSSVRTTALYWQNIYGDDDPSDILAGKKWLENREKEPPQPPAEIITPSTENLPEQLPKNLEPDITSNKPVILVGKPAEQDNSLLNAEQEKNLAITNCQPKSAISEIPSRSPGKFISKKTEISEQLPVITNKKTQQTEKEQILLEKIKQLEDKLAQVQAENSNLKTENQYLKALIKQNQKTEAKILQPPPFKPNR